MFPLPLRAVLFFGYLLPLLLRVFVIPASPSILACTSRTSVSILLGAIEPIIPTHILSPSFASVSDLHSGLGRKLSLATIYLAFAFP